MGTGTWFDLPAIVITLLVTIILVKGIQESATFNAGIVMLKVAIVLFVIVVGARYVNPANWTPFAPFGLTGISFFGHTLFGQTGPGGEPVGMLAGAAIVFFAYIGFDSVSTHAEEARNPSRDVPIGIIVSLVLCTFLYIAVAAVLTGMVPYNQINIDAPVSDAFRQVGTALGAAPDFDRRGGGHHVGPARHDVEPAANLSGDGARRPAADRVLRRGARAVPHALEVDNPDRHLRGHHGSVSAAADPRRAREHRHVAGLRHRVRGGPHHAEDASRMRSGRSEPRSARSCRCWASCCCLVLMFSLPPENWVRLGVWLFIGLVIYFTYSRHHSVVAKLARSGQLYKTFAR